MTGEALSHLTDWIASLTDKERQRHWHRRDSDGGKRRDTNHVRNSEGGFTRSTRLLDVNTWEYLSIISLIVLTLSTKVFQISENTFTTWKKHFTQLGSSLRTQGSQLMDHWVLHLEISPKNEFWLSVSVALALNYGELRYHFRILLERVTDDLTKRESEQKCKVGDKGKAWDLKRKKRIMLNWARVL